MRSILLAFLLFPLSLIAQENALSPPADIEKLILDRSNAYRAGKGASPLKLNAKLTAAAQKHCANMAAQMKYGDDNMGHLMDGQRADYRVQQEKYQFERLAENVGWVKGATGAKAAAVVMEGWIKSPGHEKNLVNDLVTEIGIGAAQDREGKWYFCQVFALGGKGPQGLITFSIINRTAQVVLFGALGSAQLHAIPAGQILHLRGTGRGGEQRVQVQVQGSTEAPTRGLVKDGRLHAVRSQGGKLILEDAGPKK